MKHPSDYRDKRVIVLGLAKSGSAVAKLFQRFGAVVTVNDKKERSACPEADELAALGISVVCGGHPDGLLDKDVALVVKNPGIPYTAPPVERALALGLEVVTEVEVAYRIAVAPIIGITGSNGKTTTTTWVGRMLDKAGLHPIVAGNIGTPLCDAAQEAVEDNRLVVELSSFQLKGTSEFRPSIACMLNVYETHLDYHGSMEDYISSKAKLFANQTEDDIAVVNWDDDVCRSLAPRIRAKLFPFSTKEELDEGVFLKGRIITYRRDGKETAILHADELGIPGEHNVENALAASAAALAAGAPPDAIVHELRAFRGVEHRLEFVAAREGVAYYNGSKATNPAATIKDLQSFKQPVVLIAGGLDRKMEYDDLIPHLRGKVRGVVALGQTRDKLVRTAEAAGIERLGMVDSADPAAAMAAAVREARSFAEPGDVVLLSPACASWDMYASYEERGRMFKQSVHNL